MGKHDRGAFGALLDEAKEITEWVRFKVDFRKDDDDQEKWSVHGQYEPVIGYGRTGEEALRDFVMRSRRG